MSVYSGETVQFGFLADHGASSNVQDVQFFMDNFCISSCAVSNAVLDLNDNPILAGDYSAVNINANGTVRGGSNNGVTMYSTNHTVLQPEFTVGQGSEFEVQVGCLPDE